MTSKFVSGPINCIRLEGNVGSIKKVLYIFMDVHETVYEQTECEDMSAPDVKKYFADSFSNIRDKNKM